MSRAGASKAGEVGRARWSAQIRRGDLFRIKHPNGDPKRSRVFVVVSRPAFVMARFSSAICAPVRSQRAGLATEVEIGTDEGLKHTSAILCDVLASLPRIQLTDYVGALGPAKLAALKVALRIALDVE